MRLSRRFNLSLNSSRAVVAGAKIAGAREPYEERPSDRISLSTLSFDGRSHRRTEMAVLPPTGRAPASRASIAEVATSAAEAPYYSASVGYCHSLVATLQDFAKNFNDSSADRK